jgi:hypothetical protein
VHFIALHVGIGRRNDKDRYAAALAALPQMLKNLVAILLRKIDVEDHDRRAGRLVASVCFVDETYRLLAVIRDMKFGIDVGGLDRVPDEEHVCGIVLDYQDMTGLVSGSLFSRGW